MTRNLKSILRSLHFQEIKPYMRLMRLDQPIGIYLCLCPALWSLSLASPKLQHSHFLLFTLGAIFMRGAGCTINDILDRSFDKSVNRTQKRPLAAGLISLRAALVFLGAQLLASLFILLTFNRLTIVLGMIIVIPIFLYPLFKRFTYWPQIFLGLVFNWGALIAWASAKNSLSIIPLLIYSSCIFWTVGYDTVYAFQDYEDDLKIGTKSAAVKIGRPKGKVFLTLCYLMFFLGLLTLAYFIKRTLLTVLFTLLLLVTCRALQRISLEIPEDCKKFFLFNGLLGFLIWSSILASNLIH